MRYILVILAASFSFCLISWPNFHPWPKINSQPGRVLGVSEAAVSFNLNREKSASLPLPLPKKKETQVFSPDKILLPRKRKSIKEVKIASAGGIVIDKATGKILFGKKNDQPRPIASITKILTALTFLGYHPDWNKVYKIKAGDIVRGGRIYLQVGDQVKLKDLFYLTLVASSNTAAKALSHAVGIKESEFVAAMNKKAEELGLNKTRIAEPTGICSRNISTVHEIALLFREAFKEKEIKEALGRASYSFKTIAGRKIVARNTDVLLTRLSGEEMAVLGGKTGFTEAAGYCFVAEFKTLNQPELIAAVLGAPTAYRRFNEAKKIVEWVYKNYIW